MDVMCAAVPDVIPLTRLADADLDLLLVIRHFERTLLDLFDRGELNGTTHTCLGQEYVPVALRAVAARRRLRLQQPPRPRPLPGPVRRPGRPARRDHGPRGRGVRRGRRQPAHPARPATCPPACRGRACRWRSGSRCTSSAPGRAARRRVHRRRHLGRGRGLRGAEHGRALATAAAGGGRAQRHRPVHPDRRRSWPARSPAGPRRSASRTTTSARPTSTSSAAELAPLVAPSARDGRPLVVEFATHRLGPHSKGDDTRSPDEVPAARRARLVPTLCRGRSRTSSIRWTRELMPMSARSSTRSPTCPLSPMGAAVHERVAENLNGALHDVLDADPQAVPARRGHRSTRTAAPSRSPKGCPPGSPTGCWHPTDQRGRNRRRGRRPGAGRRQRPSSRSCSATSSRSPSTRSSTSRASRCRCTAGGCRCDGRALPDRRRPRLRSHPQPEPAEALRRRARARPCTRCPRSTTTGRVLAEMLARGEPCLLFEDKVLYTRQMFHDGPVDELFRFDQVDHAGRSPGSSSTIRSLRRRARRSRRADRPGAGRCARCCSRTR